MNNAPVSSQSIGDWPLVTQRLTLRQFTMTDAPFVLALLNSPSWLHFIGDRNVHTLEQAQQYIQNGALKSYQLHSFGSYLVSLRDTDQAIGSCGLHRREDRPDIDLGFAFLPGFEAKGYGYEAASALMAYATQELNIDRLTALCRADNWASRALIEKLGFQYEQPIQYPDQQQCLQYGIRLLGS